MPTIRISDELYQLIESLRKQYARKTGEHLIPNQILEDALDDYDIDDYEDFDE